MPWLLADPLAAAGHRYPGLGEPAEHGVGGAVVQFGHLGGGTAGAVLRRDLGQDSALRLDRGLNALWNAPASGLMYAPPMR